MPAAPKSGAMYHLELCIKQEKKADFDMRDSILEYFRMCLYTYF